MWKIELIRLIRYHRFFLVFNRVETDRERAELDERNPHERERSRWRM